MESCYCCATNVEEKMECECCYNGTLCSDCVHKCNSCNLRICNDCSTNCTECKETCCCACVFKNDVCEMCYSEKLQIFYFPFVYLNKIKHYLMLTQK